MNTSPSSFCRTLDQWILEGGDLSVALGDYQDFQISTEAEVNSLCRALDAIHNNFVQSPPDQESSLLILSRYFQQPATEQAVEAVVNEGLTYLRWFIVDAFSGKPYSDQEILFILELLAKYHQKEDVNWIYKSILRPIAPNDAAWNTILDHFRDSHPYAKPFIAGLSKHIPSGLACLAFLKLSNFAFESGLVKPHAFESDQGLTRLKSYLNPQSQRGMEFARTAAKAMHFLDPSWREQLLSLASQHPDPVVSLQAMIDRALDGSQDDIRGLKERCMNVKLSYFTQKCLEQAGLESWVPEPAKQVEFFAMAQMAYWLSSESSYHRPPDALEIMDSRTIFWSPAHQNQLLYLIRYEYHQALDGLVAEGVGMVGSITCSLIGETSPSMPPEDIYGIHCCWELEHLGDPLAPRTRTAKTGRNILRRKNAGF